MLKLQIPTHLFSHPQISRRTRCFVIAALCASVVVGWSSNSKAEESINPSIKQFLTANCMDCHEGDSSEADFDITKLVANLNDAENHINWVKAWDRIAEGEMPPPEDYEVAPEKRKQFLNETKRWMVSYQQKQDAQKGRVHSRRLTNLQVERSLHHILGVDIPLTTLVPDEMRTDGFTTVADGQSMSHFQLEQHLSMVDAALDESFRRAVTKADQYNVDLNAVRIARKGNKGRNRYPELLDGEAVTWSSGLEFYGRIGTTAVKESGWYEISVTAKSLKQPEDKGVWCMVRTGPCVSSAPLLNWVGSFEATPEFQTWTYRTWIERRHMLEIRPGDTRLKKAGFRGGQVGAGEGGPQNVPGVAMSRITMKRIHLGPNDEQIRQLLFDDLKLEMPRKKGQTAKLNPQQPHEKATQLMTRFATRAFRRPVTENEISSYISLVHQALMQEVPFLDSLKLGYRALLCSPRFLYLNEKPGQLDDYAIASRLSYFLWAAPPDAELLKLAAQKQIHKPEVLKQQVKRMLKGENSLRFVKDFTHQWLDLSEIDFTQPDRRLYYKFDNVVMHSMVEETHQFVHELLTKNRSITDSINGNYTYLNSHLARFYNIKGVTVTGDQFQRVNLPKNSHRGGLLTQGAILKVTANGTNTSPVVRGVWVSERLLGQPIPKPSGSIPAIEPDIRGAKTIREMLEKHKDDPNCASCHKKIDPPGFALESFDAAGQWRTNYTVYQKRKRVKGPKVDPTATLIGGQSFETIEQFQKLIAENPQKLAKNLAEKFLTYGTGESTRFADREAIDHLVASTSDNNYGFASLLEAVVCSDLFLTK